MQSQKEKLIYLIRLAVTGIAALIVLGFVIFSGRGEVEAAEMKFDGNHIQWTSSGPKASGGTRYQSIGWKFTVTSQKGGKTTKKSVTYYTGVAKQSGYAKSKAISISSSTKNDIVTVVTKVDAKSIASDTKVSLREGWVTISADAIIEIYNGDTSYGIYTTKGAANDAVKNMGFRSDFDHDYKGYYGQNVTMENFYVSISGDDGIQSLSAKSGWFKKNDKISLTATVKPGYVFASWDYEKYKSSGDECGMVDTFLNVKVDCNMKVAACSELITYKVRFDGNGATSGKMDDQIFFYGKEAALKKNEFDRENYKFIGWSLKPEGMKERYGNRCHVSNLSTKDGDVVVLYAQWAPLTYRIVFEGNGVKSRSTRVFLAPWGEYVNLPKNPFEREGYEFRYWNTKPDGTGDIYRDEKKVKNLVEKPGDTITLYAIWRQLNRPPKIQADDRYVTLEEAVSGRLTEEFFMKKAHADDPEDGEILPGADEKKYFRIRDFDPAAFTSLTKSNTVALTFEASDSAGKTAEKQIQVYVVDTQSKDCSGERKRLRFIGSKYINEEPAQGGLKEDSSWNTEDDKRQLLRNTLGC